MSRLRHFQADVKAKAYQAWQEGARVVMPVIPTGGGKTVLMGDVAREYPGYGVAIAHRSELVMQISLALAKEGVRHNIVAPTKIVKQIVTAHMEDTGRSYFDARANWDVASVDTLLRRPFDRRKYDRVGLVFQDEGHHVLRENKWGRAYGLFPNAFGFFPTATPERADGRGLGSHEDGLVDVMVEGPNMGWMIENGYLTGYEIRAVKASDLDLEGVEISSTTGDYNQDGMRKRVKQSTTIVGDVVKTYLKYAAGKLGITFAVDVEHATKIAEEYNRNGVPAVVVSADTPDVDRRRYMQQFCNRELLQLVNVDLFGEGVDVPMLEVVSMARPTASYPLYVQQFGRVLRLLISPMLSAAWDTFTSEQRRKFIAESSKPVGIVLDHVGNVIAHGGPPDYRKEPWTLDGRSKRTRATDTIPMRACVNEECLQPYERFHPACPFCGVEPPPPADRSKPHFVDGDLVLYSPELLAELFGEKKKVDGPCYVPQDVGPIVAQAIKNRHRARQEAQVGLRQAISLVMPPSLPEREATRKFFHQFGVDVLTAQTLGSADAEKLRMKIIEKVTSK